MEMKKLGKSFVIAALPFALFGRPTVYLDDNFSDGDRSNPDLPTSAQWFGSWTNLEVVETTPGSGVYALKNSHITGTAVRHAVAYFASETDPVTLEVRDRIVFSADVTPLTKDPDPSFNVFRIALMDSGTARLAADGNPSLTLNGGYAMINRPAGDVLNRLYYRPNDEAQALVGSLNGWIYIDDEAPADAFEMVQNTTYSVMLEVEHLADGNVKITYSVSDAEKSFSSSWIDETHRHYSFDTVAFGWGGQFGDGLIDNVKVVYHPIRQLRLFIIT